MVEENYSDLVGFIQKFRDKIHLNSNSHNISNSDLSMYKIGVHAHIYHFDFLDEIFNTFLYFKSDVYFQLTISGDHNKQRYKILQKYLNLKNFDIRFLENRGMDVYPFMKFLLNTKTKKFDYVLKLHTKKNDPRWDSLWRALNFQHLAGNSELIFNNISFLLKNPGINMLGPSTFYKSAKKFMYLNYNSVNRFLNYLNKDDLDLVSDWGFFAGTMFWARPEIFDSLIDYISRFNLLYETSNDLSSSDGTFAHACERIFGLLPLLNNGKVATLDFNSKHNIIQYNCNPKPSLEPITHTLKIYFDNKI